WAGAGKSESRRSAARSSSASKPIGLGRRRRRPANNCFSAGCALLRTDAKSGSIKQTWDASIRGRVGVLVTAWTLVYGTGGGACEEVTGSFAYNGVILSCASPSPCVPSGTSASALANWSDTRVGGTGGAGVETEVWRGMKARIEYRYTDFGSQTKTFP